MGGLTGGFSSQLWRMGSRLAAPTIMEGYTAARNAVRPAIVGMKMHTMPLGEVETPTPTPQMRYRLGDVEINDPNLNYRQGASGLADDFLKTGKVRVKYEGAEAAKREKKPGKLLLYKSFDSPMFKQGGLWYDSWIMNEPGAVPHNLDLLVTRHHLGLLLKEDPLLEVTQQVEGFLLVKTSLDQKIPQLILGRMDTVLEGELQEEKVNILILWFLEIRSRR